MMQCQVRIASAILEHTPISYKYVVYSARANLNRHPYEFLHEPSYGDANRCIQVPREALREKGLCACYKTFYCFIVYILGTILICHTQLGVNQSLLNHKLFLKMTFHLLNHFYHCTPCLCYKCEVNACLKKFPKVSVMPVPTRNRSKWFSGGLAS